jgi:hypothetical protein
MTASSDIGDVPESRIPDSDNRLNGEIGAKSGRNRESLMIALFHAITDVGK